MSGGKEGRGLANVPRGISVDFGWKGNSHGIAAANRRERREQSVCLHYVIAAGWGTSCTEMLQTGPSQVSLWRRAKLQNGVLQAVQLLGPRQGGNIKLGVGKHRSQRPVGRLHSVLFERGHE